MGEQAEDARLYEDLPEWVPLYLAAWGSTRPDGKRMTVRWAAGLAGVDDSAVRHLRGSNPMFKRLEFLARRAGGAFMASYADAGIRGAAPAILQAFFDLVRARDVTATLTGMRWLLAKPQAVDVNLRGVMAHGSPHDWGAVPPDERDQVAANLHAALRMIGGPADLGDPEATEASTG